MHDQVEKALDSVRPILHADGGDVELVDILKNGIVQVRLIGACQTCAMAQMTLRNRIEYAVKKQVPGIKAVEAV
ncbi:MAG: NifU family protein [Desulfomicrobium sp.]|jgi:Fe-S cluster biogenesis protein NfuA|nr:NifU family protein [Desulfomicrobium sp.]NLV97565.1 NifU family protein [Desulfovibrionales bacterium]